MYLTQAVRSQQTGTGEEPLAPVSVELGSHYLPPVTTKECDKLIPRRRC